MAKKVNIKNVDINSGELNPVTIGYLNSRKKGPFLLIFVIGAIAAVAYYMPEISNYINKYLNPQAYEAQKLIDEDVPNVVNEKGKQKELNANTKVTINNIVFSDFILNGDTISFKINDTSKLENYYLRTYDKNKNLLETLPIDVSGKVKLESPTVSYIAIDILENYVAPKDEDDDELEELSCVKDYVTYKYSFDDNGLVEVVYTLHMTKADNDPNYQNEYTNALAEADKMPIGGISTLFTHTEDDFSLIRTYDLKTATMTSINNENVFSYKEKKDTINSTMSDKGYTCN